MVHFTFLCGDKDRTKPTLMCLLDKDSTAELLLAKVEFGLDFVSSLWYWGQNSRPCRSLTRCLFI